MAEYSRSILAFPWQGRMKAVKNGRGLHDDLVDLLRDRRANGQAFEGECVVRMPRRRRYKTHPMYLGRCQ